MRRIHKRPTELICRIDMTAFLSIQVVLLSMFMGRINEHGDLSSTSVDLARVVHSVAMRGALREDALLVAVQRDGRIWFGTGQITPEQLPAAIRERVSRGAPSKVYIRADARAKYGTVLEVLDGVRSAGIENIGFLVDDRHLRSSP
jgi:biopolymer transport protein TolR